MTDETQIPATEPEVTVEAPVEVEATETTVAPTEETATDETAPAEETEAEAPAEQA